jgi:hypothetical protein
LSKRDEGERDTEQAEYQPTERERVVLRKQAERRDTETPPLQLEVLSKGEDLIIDHPDTTIGRQVLMEALGTANPHFSGGLLHLLTTAARSGDRLDKDIFDFMLSVITGIKPRDQVDAMLAAQMSAVHVAMMKITQRFSDVEDIRQQDSAGRALNKLAGTFTTQVETLRRYRSGGDQKPTVQHVSVGEGGQAAIVGNLTQAAPPIAPEEPANTTPALTDARQPAMQIIEEPEHVRVPLRRRRDDGGRSST